ncbi:MAG: toxin-antitoxin system protein [Clostridia bacterium]|nr:toxin-antitoxin system protein [Clostridia bacterium]
MKELKQKISITLDPSVIEKLRLLAEIEDRSLSQYINLVLKNHIEHTEK